MVENSTQKGYEYEKNASSYLKQYGITDGSYDGSKTQGPDIVLHSEKSSTGCEMKILPTAAGSLVLQYYGTEWHYGPTDGNEEKEFLETLGESKNALKLINSTWKTAPLLQYGGSNHSKKIYPPDVTPKLAYETDIKTFGSQGYGDIYIPIAGNDISRYYISKGCSYLNVGTHGFYILEDEFGLNKKMKTKIPNFASSITAKIRIRIQYKGSGSYQFALTLLFSGVKKSPYNLAPVAGSSSVAIIKSKVSKQLLDVIQPPKKK